MPDYKAMYLKLFNDVTDALKILQKAQQDGENAYIESKDMPLVLLKKEYDKTEKCDIESAKK